MALGADTSHTCRLAISRPARPGLGSGTGREPGPPGSRLSQGAPSARSRSGRRGSPAALQPTINRRLAPDRPTVLARSTTTLQPTIYPRLEPDRRMLLARSTAALPPTIYRRPPAHDRPPPSRPRDPARPRAARPLSRSPATRSPVARTYHDQPPRRVDRPRVKPRSSGPLPRGRHRPGPRSTAASEPDRPGPRLGRSEIAGLP